MHPFLANTYNYMLVNHKFITLALVKLPLPMTFDSYVLVLLQ